jgi:hypothetical protein
MEEAFVHGEYGMEVMRHKDPISCAKIIVQLLFIFSILFWFLFCFKVCSSFHL